MGGGGKGRRRRLAIGGQGEGEWNTQMSTDSLFIGNDYLYLASCSKAFAFGTPG